MLKSAIQILRASLHDRAGVSSIEYGVLAVGIIAAVSAAMLAFTGFLSTAYTDLGNLIVSNF